MMKIAFSDNVEWSSKICEKMMSADLKTSQNLKVLFYQLFRKKSQKPPQKVEKIAAKFFL